MEGTFSIVCHCIIGNPDCKYCKGSGYVEVKLIGPANPMEWTATHQETINEAN